MHPINLAIKILQPHNKWGNGVIGINDLPKAKQEWNCEENPGVVMLTVCYTEEQNQNLAQLNM